MLRIFPILLILALAFGCKKSTTSGNNSTGSDSAAAVTDIGTPNGDPVTKTIGAAGGTIISTDGRAELNIPAGALSSDLAITIQPVTNECPNGVGVAYDFLPNGTRFSIPATLTLHYTDDDVDGTDPYLLNMAFQDSLNEWEVDIYKDVDTVAKTIIFDVSHFTPRAANATIIVKPPVKLSSLSGTSFTENQQGIFIVSQGMTKAQRTGDPDPALAWTLPKPTQVSNDIVTNWKLTPGDQNGSISATSGSYETYTAPNTILQAKTVRLYATVKIDAVSAGRNKQKSKVSSGYKILSIGLHLIPELRFSVKVVVNSRDVSGYGQAYHDEATFEVDVKSHVVTVPTEKIQNSAPTVTPATSVTANDSSVWVRPDPYGTININSGTGYTTPDATNSNLTDIIITLKSSNTTDPSFNVYDRMTQNLSPIVGSSTDGFPLGFTFILKDEVQVLDPNFGNADQGLQTTTIVPIH